ncbi:MAG: hypothetical protein RLZZ528_712 [Pseudomonadota bacterium]
MSAVLAPATPGDAAALGAILSDWIDATGWLPRLHTRDEDRGFVAHLIAAHQVIVARDGGGPAGFIVIDGTTISALYLAQAARGRGIGAQLLSAAKSGRETLSLWTFQANAGARRFYLREGFREVEWTDGAGNEALLPDVRLEWRRA